MTVYDEFVARLCKPGADIDLRDPDDKHLVHMIFGLTSELGELVDACKKYLIYNQPLDMDNIREELGDLEFYLSGLRTGLEKRGGDRREGILAHNMAKLSLRYNSGAYTDEDAKIRADKS